ncbi:MAG: hypothetical protein ACK443_04890 [Methylococcaceae bacterium]
MDRDNLKNKGTVIVEATYALNPNVNITFNRQRPTTTTTGIQEAFPDFNQNRGQYNLQSIRLRIGVDGNSTSSVKTPLRAGIFTGTAFEIGGRFEETIEAGIDYATTIHTWYPDSRDNNNDSVPPPFLICR